MRAVWGRNFAIPAKCEQPTVPYYRTDEDRFASGKSIVVNGIVLRCNYCSPVAPPGLTVFDSRAFYIPVGLLSHLLKIHLLDPALGLTKTGANKRNRAVADQGLVWWRPGDRSYRCEELVVVSGGAPEFGVNPGSVPPTN